MEKERGMAGTLSEIDAGFSANKRLPSGPEVIYVGDPMCSWCWGVAPVVTALSDYCTVRGIGFSIVVGGLRPGGHAPWNEQMRALLRHHWQEVATRTGQPFGMTILERNHFNYDTEPACRAVVTARGMLASDQNSKILSAFFAAIQRKFYVDGEDPAEQRFYHTICDECGLDYDAFMRAFNSVMAKERTEDDFRIRRSWGVSGFPSFLTSENGTQTIIAAGYLPFENLVERIETAFGKGA